jgi:phospholipase C
MKPEAGVGKLVAKPQKQAIDMGRVFHPTVDEGGGYYDSGFIQPVDFFGTGPRIPMIAVSPFSRGGHISRIYNEHSSFVKFVERNWHLGKLSRDNLPNPRVDDDHPYVPVNMPPIGDLFDLFDFDRDHDRDHDHDRDDRDFK